MGICPLLGRPPRRQASCGICGGKKAPHSASCVGGGAEHRNDGLRQNRKYSSLLCSVWVLAGMGIRVGVFTVSLIWADLRGVKLAIASSGEGAGTPIRQVYK